MRYCRWQKWNKHSSSKANRTNLWMCPTPEPGESSSPDCPTWGRTWGWDRAGNLGTPSLDQGVTSWAPAVLCQWHQWLVWERTEMLDSDSTCPCYFLLQATEVVSFLLWYHLNVSSSYNSFQSRFLCLNLLSLTWAAKLPLTPFLLKGMSMPW